MIAAALLVAAGGLVSVPAPPTTPGMRSFRLAVNVFHRPYLSKGDGECPREGHKHRLMIDETEDSCWQPGFASRLPSRWTLIHHAARPEIHPMLAAIQKLVVSDIGRGLSSLEQLEASCTLGRVEECHEKLTRWLDTRMPIVQWATTRWLSCHLGVECVVENSLTFRSAIVPLKPWRQYRKAIIAAPLRAIAFAWLCCCLWMCRSASSASFVQQHRQRILPQLINDVAIAYDRIC